MNNKASRWNSFSGTPSNLLTSIIMVYFLHFTWLYWCEIMYYGQFSNCRRRKKINFLRVVMPLTNCFLSFLGNFQQTRCLLLDNKIQWNRYDMTEFPVSRLKFPLVKHFAQINKSTINITVCFVHWWTVRENLCYPIKSVILNSLIFPPFSVDSTESIGVCNSKQARCWKCQRQWSFITSQQILASLKSLFSWFFVTRLILLQSIEAQQKSEPCQKVKELPWDTSIHREKEMCIEHIFCMHSIWCVIDMWLHVESYIDYV